MGSILSCCSKDYEDINLTKNLQEFESLYQLGSILGVGQFSEVKEARLKDDSKNELKFAVKCINLSRMKSDEKLLKRELSIIKKIRHDHIVDLYEIYKSQEFIYITMELCSGGSLKERVNNDGPLSSEKVKTLACDLLKTLDYLHSMNICHRDLKPENILFTENGKVKLADFGFARLMEGTNKFTLVGTPYYLSPEVISGDYNTKCDVWSLGVALYFALTRRLPFYGEGFEDLFERITLCDIDWFGVEEEEVSFLSYLLVKDYKLRPSAKQALQHVWLQGR
jgi:serine/threonine protein kinase